MKKNKKEVQCFVSSRTIEQLGYPDRFNHNYRGHIIMFLSDIIVDHKGKLLKSRHSRLDKRLTAKDLRSFEGAIFKVPFESTLFSKL